MHYEPTFAKSVITSKGEIRVQAEKCRTCPFKPESPVAYQLKEIIKNLKLNPSMMLCHSTYFPQVEGAICRGSYDTGVSTMEDLPIRFEQSEKDIPIEAPEKGVWEEFVARRDSLDK